MGAMRESVWIGFDRREAAAYAVSRSTCAMWMGRAIPTYGVVLQSLVARGLSTRKIETRVGVDGGSVMWDSVSEAPQSTEHANSRFLVPYLARSGWALFCDGDVLFREDVGKLFDGLSSSLAVACVQHSYDPPEGVKMDGQSQTRYSRKNWSSVVAFNCDHPANQCVVSSTEMANTLPGRDLHRFCWLEDKLIGALDPAWNFLVGHTDSSIEPSIVHFTRGTPDMPGYENEPYADEWREAYYRWAE